MSQIKYWNGTSWVNAIVGAAGPAGEIGITGNIGSQGASGAAGNSHTLISTTSLAASTSNSISVPTVGYNKIILLVRNWSTSASPNTISYRINNNSGAIYANGNSTAADTSIANSESSRNTQTSISQLEILFPESITLEKLTNYIGYNSTGSMAAYSIPYIINTTSAVSIIQIITSSGAITGGTAYLYGIL